MEPFDSGNPLLLEYQKTNGNGEWEIESRKDAVLAKLERKICKKGEFVIFGIVYQNNK